MFTSYNTCQHGERVFHFSLVNRRLAVTEVIIGEEVECVTVETHVECGVAMNWYIGSCSLGDRMLVMSSFKNKVLAVLVAVGPGRLSAETIFVTELTVTGLLEWVDCPYLCRVSDRRALLCFHNNEPMWYCTIVGGTLEAQKLQKQMPASGRFCGCPLRVSDGKVLVAGSFPLSKDIVMITPERNITFDTVGSVPGVARGWTSTVLLGDRFVAGFGGRSDMLHNDLWIFDLRTCKSSPVDQQGDWHPATSWVSLAVRDNFLYLIGGDTTTIICSISFDTLSDLIQNEDIRGAFKSAFRQLPQCPSDYERLACIPLLQDEVYEARRQIEDLRLQLARMQESVLRQAVPGHLNFGELRLQLAFKAFSVGLLPQKWAIDVQRLKEADGALALHKRNILSATTLFKGYKNVFSPFLGKALPRMFLSASAAAAGRRAHESVVSQASVAISPGELFAKRVYTPLLSRKRHLRQDAKILDSSLMKRLRVMAEENDRQPAGLFVNPHPSYSSALSLANAHDPLMDEAGHLAFSKFRRSVQTSKLISSVERVGGLDRQINILQKARKLRNLGFCGEWDAKGVIPWLVLGAAPQNGEEV